MRNLSKYLPWALSVVLAILLGLLWFDSKSTIEKKDAEIAFVKQRYQQLVNEANDKIAQANAHTQQLVAEANARIQLANQPEVPVRVGFRKALISSGQVAIINNTSAQTIYVTIQINRTSGQNKSIDLTIDAGMSKEIGEREGWAFISGDVITATQAEHKSVTFQVP